MNYGKKKKMKDGGRTKKPKVRDLLQRGKPKPPQKPKLPKMGDKPKYTPAMKDGGMARKKMKEAFLSAPRSSVEDFKKEREAVMKKMKDGGMDKKKKMAMGGKMKPVDKKKNPGLAKLPTEVRNKMGFMKKGGSAKKAVTEGMKKAAKTAAGLGAAIAKVKKKQAKDKSPKGFRGDPNKDGTFKKDGTAKKKMMGGGMAMKYKHGGKVGKKCPRDGIAMKGKTRA